MCLNNDTFQSYNSSSYRWVVVLLLLIVNSTLLASKIENIQSPWESVYSVLYYKSIKSYKTVSRVIGSKEYIINSEPNLIVTYSKGNVELNLLTYEEFDCEINKNTVQVDYIQNLPEAINDFIHLFEIQNLKLKYNIILLPKGYELKYESKLTKVSDVITFTFISSVNNDMASQLELGLIRTLPHELFHFLVKYTDVKNMNLLRNETYAHLFGQCVSYELNPLIQDEIELNFPDYFFKDPNEDFPKVIKKLEKSSLVKKNQFPKSHLGHALARYYFQAVADERNGAKISSENIPKFCHKLFSEHNFKHPIEKKPPKWFKGFLKRKQKV